MMVPYGSMMMLIFPDIAGFINTISPLSADATVFKHALVLDPLVSPEQSNSIEMIFYVSRSVRGLVKQKRDINCKQ